MLGFRSTRGLVSGLIALLVLMSGCGVESGSTSEPATDTLVSGLTGQDMADQIDDVVAHPLYGPLTVRSAVRMKTVFDTVWPMTEAQRAQALADINACQDLAACTVAIAAVGVAMADLQADRADAQQILADVGIPATPAWYPEAVFMAAEFTQNGSAGDSDLLAIIGALPCDGECPKLLGNHLARANAAAVEVMSISNDAEIKAALSILIGLDAILQMIGVLAGPYESDECTKDSGCGPTEYCHLFGPNDCRPREAMGAFCRRNGACASGCCRWHISAFTFICRPTNRCNNPDPMPMTLPVTNGQLPGFP